MFKFLVLIAIFAIGTEVFAERLCILVSFTYNGRTTWALESSNTLECTKFAIGGHSSLEHLPKKLLLFENPDILLSAGEDVQTISYKKRLNTFSNFKSGKRYTSSVGKSNFECVQESFSSAFIDSTTNVLVEEPRTNTLPFAILNEEMLVSTVSTGPTDTMNFSYSVQPGTSETAPVYARNQIYSSICDDSGVDMSCNGSERVTDCCCESYNASNTRVTEDIVRHCYCSTSAGRCEWFPQDCSDLCQNGIEDCGVYTIYLTWPNSRHFNVYCNMTIDGGGWTVFQRRHGDSAYFTRTKKEYEYGFGDLMGEFWLGITKLCLMSQQRINKLRIDRNRFESSLSQYASTYDNFNVSCEKENYKLITVGRFTMHGKNSLDGLSQYEDKVFSSCDGGSHCECGWWCCGHCSRETNLNGREMKWKGYSNYIYSEMKIKP